MTRQWTKPHGLDSRASLLAGLSPAEPCRDRGGRRTRRFCGGRVHSGGCRGVANLPEASLMNSGTATGATLQRALLPGPAPLFFTATRTAPWHPATRSGSQQRWAPRPHPAGGTGPFAEWGAAHAQHPHEASQALAEHLWQGACHAVGGMPKVPHTCPRTRATTKCCASFRASAWGRGIDPQRSDLH